MTFDYKEYSLGQLENWIHDVVSSAEVSPQQIYDCICNALNEEYLYYKNGADRVHTLMNMFSGDKSNEEKSWVLPVEVDGLTGDCVVTFPDELIERAGWKEGDILQWIDNGDGTFSLTKKDET